MRVLLGLLAATAILHADAASDLKSALRGLASKQAVRLKVVQKGWDEEEGKREAFEETFVVADGPEGVRVSDGKARTSPRVKGHRGDGTRTFVRAQEALLEDLAEAKLLEDKADTLEGRPVRRLRFAVDPDLSDEDRAHLKRAVSECTVWIGADGLPVAWQRNLDLKVRVLLVVSMDLKLDLRRTFQRHQDRLVVISETVAVKGQAMGHPFAAESRSVGRLEP
ncbi:MAG: hypothetical protein IPL96_09425 [Holophagaceae bacterium]|nr:hypothetical protein [Holophagaceae bacterium]